MNDVKQLKKFCHSCKWNDYTETDKGKNKIAFWTQCFVQFLIGNEGYPVLEGKWNDMIKDLPDTEEIGLTRECDFHDSELNDFRA